MTATHPSMTQPILIAKAPHEIANCYPVLQELRPKLKDQKAFVKQILQQIEQGYNLVYIRDDGEVQACMGFRIFETLAWGKILYIDDLITREKARKKGFGSLLLEYAKTQGTSKECAEIHLDSGHHRFDAHRLYLKLGFKINCHHLALSLND